MMIGSYKLAGSPDQAVGHWSDRSIPDLFRDRWSKFESLSVARCARIRSTRMWRGPSNLIQPKSDRKILQDISNVPLLMPFPSKDPTKEGICAHAHDSSVSHEQGSILEWRINKQDVQISTPVSLFTSSRFADSASTPPPAHSFDDTSFYKDGSPQQSACVKDIIDFIDQVGSILDKSTHDQSTVEELLCFMDMAADKIKVPTAPSPRTDPHPHTMQ
jgi:hypothetical protein